MIDFLDADISVPHQDRSIEEGDMKMDKTQFSCITLDFKDQEGKRCHIQFNGRWLVEDEPDGATTLISMAITENNQFFVYHILGDNKAYYEVFASWEELLCAESCNESMLDLVWNEIKDSMLEVLEI